MPYLPWKQDPFEPNKQFTDRESFRKILQDAVLTPHQPDQYNMLVIYGAGGQGKSALKEFFVKWLEETSQTDKSLVYAHLDFEYVERNRQVDEALLGLSEQLIGRHKFPLPCFSFGILRYKQLVHPEKNLESLYPYLFKVKGVSSEIYQEIISLAADVIGVLGVNLLLKKGTAKLLEWLKRRDVNKLIGHLDEMSPAQLLEQLPYLLAFDVYQEMERCRAKEKEKRLVFVMDGYESLWKFETNRKTDKDEWIRKLVLSMPGVLVTVFGRDRLRWAEAENNPNLENVIRQLLLTGLQDEDADQYLQQVPIPEKNIRQVIIASSKSAVKPAEGCLPFYLSLQVDTYAHIRNQDKPVQVQDFGGSQQKIVNHFFEHINTITANAIQVLAIPNIIDEAVIEELIQKNYISPSAVTIADLKGYSFFYSDGKSLTMHSLMREMCMKQLQQDAPLRYQQIHEALFNYFHYRLPVLPEDGGWRNVTGEWELVLEQLAYHKGIYDPENFSEWVLRETDNISTGNAWNTVPNILEKAFSMDKDGLTQGRILKRLADCFGQVHNYAKQNSYLKRAITIFESIEETTEVKTASTGWVYSLTPELERFRQITAELGTCYIERAEALLDNNALTEAAGQYAIAAEWAAKHNLPFNEYKYALLLEQLGRLADAEPVLLKHYYSSRKNFDEWSMAIAAHDLSKLVFTQGRYDEAKKFSREASRVMQQEKGSHSVDYAHVQMRLVYALIREGVFLEEAKAALQAYEAIYLDVYGENNWHLQWLYATWGHYYCAMNDIAPALEMYRKALVLMDRSPNSNSSEKYDLLVNCTANLFHHHSHSGPHGMAYEVHCLKFLSLMMNDFQQLKNIGIYRPSLRRGMDLYIALSEQIGNITESNRMRTIQRELDRIMQHQGRVRLDGFPCTVLTDGDRNAFIDCIKNLTSLPDNPAELEVTRVDLPFFKLHVLYQVRFKNVKPWYAKYVLTDGETFQVYNRKHLMAGDLSLDKKDVHQYVRFVYDSVSMNDGNLYVVGSADDIPWQLDKPQPEGLADCMQALIKPFPVEETEAAFLTRVWVVLRQFIYLYDVEINKSDGSVTRSNEQFVQFYRDGEGNTQYIIPQVSSFAVEDKDLIPLPISTMPLYDLPTLSPAPYILQERIEVRTAAFTQVPVTEERASALFNRFRSLAELPEDMTGVRIEEYTLPFYKTARLFKVIQTATQPPVYHYFTGHDEELDAFSWTNKFIYQLGKTGLALTEENAISYAKFFFDSVMGPEGRFLLLDGPEGIPWTKDAIPDGELEQCITSTVKPVRFLMQHNYTITLEACIIFKSSLFKSDIHINTRNGHISLTNEKLITFAVDEHGVYKPQDAMDNPDPDETMQLPVWADPLIPFKQEIESIIRLIDAAKLFCQVSGSEMEGHDLSGLGESVARNGINDSNKEAALAFLREYGKRLEEKLPAYIKVLYENDDFIEKLRMQQEETGALIKKVGELN